MISFGFNKRADTTKLHSPAVDDDNLEKQEADYLVSLEDGKIKSTKPVLETTYSIPLILTNRWGHAKKPYYDLETVSSSKGNTKCDAKADCIISSGDSLTDAAVNEILTDAVCNTSAGFNNLAIPLTEKQVDVDLCPDEGYEEDYERVPIEQFGLAMLRGMGWKDGQGIGKNCKIVKPVEPLLRPKGLGLGADRSLTQQSVNLAQSSLDKNTDNEEILSMKKGTHCIFVLGKYNGQCGTIAGVDEDNARIVITLAIGGDIVTVSQFSIKLISTQEFNKISKYIINDNMNKYTEKMPSFDNCDQYKKAYSRMCNNADNHHKRCSKRDGHYADMQEPVAKHKYQYSVCSDEQKYTNQQIDENRITSWLHPHLKVRIVDPSFRNGKYYKTKVTVLDVPNTDHCVCETEDGQVLDDLRQPQLETVIPHNTPSYVMIVSGKYCSQLGQLLERDRKNSTAVVQLMSDRDVVLDLDFDSICEYTADVNLMT